MNRRRFLFFSAASAGALLLTGCRRFLPTQPEALDKVHITEPPGDHGGGDVPFVRLLVNVGNVARDITVPLVAGMTVRQVLDWASANRGLDIGYGVSPSYGHYVVRMNGVTVDATSLFTLLYAVGGAPFATDDQWLAAFAGHYIDHQPAPPNGGVIDWRLAIP